MRYCSILAIWVLAFAFSEACTSSRPAEPDVVSDVQMVPNDMVGFDSVSADTPNVRDIVVIREAGVCTDDSQCSDGVFCNGRERCAAGIPGADVNGCVRATVGACRPEQTCSEAMGRCVTDCMATGDADGDGVRAVECGGTDCDDSDRLRRPGAAEVCDADSRDEDCNPLTFGTRDRDGDGFTDRACCNVDGVGMRVCGTDCNDFRRSQSPGALEVCNGLDEDCDGVVDNGVTQSFFPDRDFDLYGGRGAMQAQACPGLRGYSLVDLDCDDMDPAVSGPQPEFCDGRDNNCNGMTDENTQPVRWYPDDDGDGFGVERGAMSSCSVPDPRGRWVLRAGDCNDSDATINPAAAEVCDGLDNNCNGRAEFRIGAGDTEDDDQDGAADLRCAGFGTDCNDNNPEIYGAFVNVAGMRVTAAAEICDGQDNDCNGMVDDRREMASWYPDRDGDGYGDRSVPAMVSCDIPPGLVRNDRDCDDANRNRAPSVIDPCNGIDDDCDGMIDEDAANSAWFRDGDRDGIGGSGMSMFACRRPSADAMGGWSERSDDCNDMDPLIYPGAPERCNMQDDNCDLMADNGALVTFFEDTDRDGHGSMVPGRRTSMACVAPMGFAAIADDCDDADPRRFPGNLDVCDSVDNDCNGVVDQPAAADLACSRPHATSTCTMGRCGALVCDSAYSDCNGLNMDGCEINTRTILNCNGCGVNCGRPNSVADCNSGVCRISECLPGFSNCDGNEANGCETATNSVNNCGRCAMACAPGASCLPMGGGYTCGCPGAGGLLCGGRCVNTTIDPLNCGGCGTVCAIGASCQLVGAMGTCVCPMAAATVCNGRCTDTQTDRNHCGGCGQVCEATCVGGVCIRPIDLASGAYHTCIILNDVARTVRCWGFGGEVGDGTNNTRTVQTSVDQMWSAMMPPRVPITLSSAQSSGTTILRMRVAGLPDETWYWGRDSSLLGPRSDELSPVRTAVLGGAVDSVLASTQHVCFLRGGNVFCFGANGGGQCGPPMGGSVAAPRQLAGITSVRSLHLGALGTVVLRNNGTGYGWGMWPGPTPQLIATPGQTFESVATNERAGRFVVTTTAGLVAIAQSDQDYAYCSPACDPQQPTIVPLAAGELATSQIALNEGVTCVVLREPMPGVGGEVRCRGLNTSGELADGTLVNSFTAWRTVLVGPGRPLSGVTRIAAGQNFVCTLNVSGAVHCWGDNTFGQIGDGTVIRRRYATPILWP